ncbi:DUF559 domain-containing protein [Microbacterium hominis]|uniref:DUF559 domain-containing protein n=2 Tax=Microbacterium hominis TaxID=162426 RepID=A0A7D4PPV7_9MICO|nr:DUF559 domain-containing protein [Microbacterium hominis]
MSRHRVTRAVADGTLIRVRNGRLVPAGTHIDLVTVARWGGRLDCVSLLRHLGIFVLERGAPHVQLDPKMTRLPERPAGVVAHWRATTVPREALVTDLIEALAQATRCQDPRSAIATLDSAWHLGLVDAETLDEVFARLPHRYQVLRGLLDPSCESGPESLVRLILRALGCRYETQVKIPGVGRVDFVVDGWLIIECDSEQHHSDWVAVKRDRRRDFAAAERGYTTVRLLAEDVMWDRERITASLRRVVRTRRPARGRQNSGVSAR